MANTAANTELSQPMPSARHISLSVRAGEVFANRKKELAWLQTATPSLQGRSPIKAVNTEEGFDQGDDILTRIQHGVLG